MPEKLNNVVAEAVWYPDDPDTGPSESVDLDISFEGDTFYIDGLRDGEYLSLPLGAIAAAIAFAN